MVPKTHERIIFRGALDIFEAEIIEAQVLCARTRENEYRDALGEILSFLRSIMKAEVTNAPLKSFSLFGLSADELWEQSNNIHEVFGLASVPIPDYNLCPLAVRLNYLRARVRRIEIHAIKAFGNKEEHPCGPDIIKSMNRWISGLWCLKV